MIQLSIFRKKEDKLKEEGSCRQGKIQDLPYSGNGRYTPLLDKLTTEKAIEVVRETFITQLEKRMNLMKVTAPLAVEEGTGINDDLGGGEKPVTFHTKNYDLKGSIVQSLAKWKRLRLADLTMEPGRGIWTDMKALRPDDILSPIHSVYVDQWDWEKCILPHQRTPSYLRSQVEHIYEALKKTEATVCGLYPSINPLLPEKIKFIHSQELLDEYPNLPPAEREKAAARKYGAIFITGIGHTLKNGLPHDKRAPDYDDWSTACEGEHRGLNGDIILWNPVTGSAFEISSMGIRVDKKALIRQLDLSGCPERKSLAFHKMLLEDKLPLSAGGGIGQSRICMFMLRKAHIGEVQAGIWPADIREECRGKGIELI